MHLLARKLLAIGFRSRPSASRHLVRLPAAALGDGGDLVCRQSGGDQFQSAQQRFTRLGLKFDAQLAVAGGVELADHASQRTGSVAAPGDEMRRHAARSG